MNAVHTSAAQFQRIAEILASMRAAGLPEVFLDQLATFARESAPLVQMMEVWAGGEPGDDRDDTVVHLQAMIDELEDAAAGANGSRTRIPFEKLESEVLLSVQDHKRRLRELIDRHGGVSAVARKAGIPQPSLSRMLNDGSRPRRATLYKIAAAIDVDESDVVGEYVR
jgi:transcriptional regulator with XRE-family HTH domain